MKTIVIFIISAILFTSCTMDTKIDWKLQPHADMLVVNGVITNELKQQRIHLTLSAPYFQAGKPRAVSEALVTVSDGKTIFGFREDESNPGWYLSETSFGGEINKTYTLNIKLKEAVNGRTEYASLSAMPEGMNVDSVKCEIYQMPDFNQVEEEGKEKDTTLLAVYFFGNDPLRLPNYYLAKAFRNDKPLAEDAKDFLSFEANDKNYTHLISFQKNIADADHITFELYTISKSYYEYLRAIKNMDSNGDAMSMSGPPANAVGNIDSALGYFLVTYVSRQSAQAEDRR